LSRKINEISINIFEELYVTFLDYMLWKKHATIRFTGSVPHT